MKLIDDLQFSGYRISTILRSGFALYRLSPQEVNAFVKSYDIYDCDWVDGKAVKDSKVIEYDTVIENILNYYRVINHLCAIGDVEKMYIPPVMDPTKGIIANQNLFEEKFSRQLGMKAEDNVLEMGCGRGRVAAHLASFSGAKITGFNIDTGQLDNAVWYAQKKGLSEQCTFLYHDVNDIPFPFPDSSFDSAYEIQVLSYSKDLDKLFKELYRVLKPGAKLSILDWVSLPNYDPNNPYHRDLMKRIKPLIGAIGTPTPKEYETALQKAGFKVLLSEEPSVDHNQDALVDNASNQYSNISKLIHFLRRIKVIPEHFITIFDRLTQDGEALFEAEEKGLVTTSYHIVAQKS